MLNSRFKKSFNYIYKFNYNYFLWCLTDTNAKYMWGLVQFYVATWRMGITISLRFFREFTNR